MAQRGGKTGDPAPAALGDAEYQALGAFRRALREFLAFSETGSLEHGLTAQQHQALLAIRAHHGAESMTIGELAASLLVKNHSAVGLVARLIDRGLVARTQSREDMRRVLLALTPAGAQVLETISLRNVGQITRTAEILTGIVATTRRIKDVLG